MANKIDKDLQKIVDYYTEKAERDFDESMEYAVDELYSEVKNMYDTLITQFYLYKTTSYVRHWEGKPGTMKGSNLYYALRIRKLHSNGMAYLHWEIDAEDMADGYKLDRKDDVLDAVLMGYRWPFDFANSPEMKWDGSYVGKYFSYRGTPEEIFKHFDDTYEEKLTPIFMTKWRSLGWK